MIRRVILPLLLPLFLLAGCATGAQDAATPQGEKGASRYTAETGQSPVGSIPDIALRDAQRGRDVVMTIDYPTRGDAHPLIVFSHGFGGSNRGNTGLASYWASNGYVVIRPRHADSGKLRDIDSPDEIWSSQTPADWSNRVRDVTVILDSLDLLEQQYPELKGKIDRTKIGVGGHSYGAFTAMLVGGGRTFPGGTRYADPRVKAIVAMSPQGPASDRGLTAESWAELKVPALFMTGSLDRGVSEAETPEWRRQAWALAPAGDKWFVSIDGARHASFSGRASDIMDREQESPFAPQRPTAVQQGSGRPVLSSAAMREQQIFGTVKALSLAFWDLYLRGDPAGREELEKAAGRGATVEKK